jgi:hypothetical protein
MVAVLGPIEALPYHIHTYIASDIRMIDKRKITEDLEGSGSDIMAVRSRNFYKGPEESHDIPQPG